MAFNFGAETPPTPPLFKVEENGYVVGQENGYSGVRVRIKSLKTTKKETPPEEKPAADKNEEPRVVPLPRVVELKLFDLPPIEAAKDPMELPADPTDILAGPTESPGDLAEAVVVEKVFVQPEIPETDEIVIGEPLPPPPVTSAPPPVTYTPPESPATVKKSAPGKPAKSKRGRKSLKQVSAEADLIEVPGDEILFSKQYYTMRAVAEMFRVNQSLLRFWETEFDILQPRKNKKGDRYFRPVDIKNLHLIYHLLRQRKYTIEGAKEFLKKNKKADERFEAIQRLQQLKAFLLEWKAQL